MFSEHDLSLIVAAAVSSIISGTLVLISGSNNNNFQLKREEEQRIWQKKVDQEKWYREKVYESYRKSIQVLTEMIQIKFETEQNYMINENKTITYHRLCLDLRTEVEIIINGYPPTEFEQFREKMKQFTKHFETDPSKSKSILSELMEDDSRIKTIITNN